MMNKFLLIIGVMILIAGLGVGGVKVYQKVRGLRNNNPLNIEIGEPWDGLSPVQADSRFCQFVDVVYGIRAAARILTTYSHDGITTLEEIIRTWAPPEKDGKMENDTEAYIKSVMSRTGFPRNKIIRRSSGDYVPLLKAMIVQENGLNPYSDAVIQQGVALS